jgi:hypothetical protein
VKTNSKISTPIAIQRSAQGIVFAIPIWVSA